MKKVVDNVGRVQIPKDLRIKYNLDKGASYMIKEEDNGIKIEPLNGINIISGEDMKVLRKLYLMLNASGLLDTYYDTILANITKKTDSKCAKCGNPLFLETDNTYKCYECE